MGIFKLSPGNYTTRHHFFYTKLHHRLSPRNMGSCTSRQDVAKLLKATHATSTLLTKLQDRASAQEAVIERMTKRIASMHQDNDALREQLTEHQLSLKLISHEMSQQKQLSPPKQRERSHSSRKRKERSRHREQSS